MRWRSLVVRPNSLPLRALAPFAPLVSHCPLQELCKGLRGKFMSSGPSSPGMDLDVGLDLVREYKQQLSEINHQKEALVNAQKLFGIDVTRYPELQVRGLLDLID